MLDVFAGSWSQTPSKHRSGDFWDGVVGKGFEQRRRKKKETILSFWEAETMPLDDANLT